METGGCGEHPRTWSRAVQELACDGWLSQCGTGAGRCCPERSGPHAQLPRSQPVECCPPAPLSLAPFELDTAKVSCRLRPSISGFSALWPRLVKPWHSFTETVEVRCREQSVDIKFFQFRGARACFRGLMLCPVKDCVHFLHSFSKGVSGVGRWFSYYTQGK